MLFIKNSPISAFTLFLAAIFQWLTRIVVYSFMIIGTLLIFASMIFLWVKYSDDQSTNSMIAAIMATIFSFFWIVFIAFTYKKIVLVLKLYEIAAKVTFDQPVVLLISFGVSGINKF